MKLFQFNYPIFLIVRRWTDKPLLFNYKLTKLLVINNLFGNSLWLILFFIFGRCLCSQSAIIKCVLLLVIFIAFTKFSSWLKFFFRGGGVTFFSIVIIYSYYNNYCYWCFSWAIFLVICVVTCWKYFQDCFFVLGAYKRYSGIKWPYLQVSAVSRFFWVSVTPMNIPKLPCFPIIS